MAMDPPPLAVMCGRHDFAPKAVARVAVILVPVARAVYDNEVTSPPERGGDRRQRRLVQIGGQRLQHREASHENDHHGRCQRGRRRNRGVAHDQVMPQQHGANGVVKVGVRATADARPPDPRQPASSIARLHGIVGNVDQNSGRSATH